MLFNFWAAACEQLPDGGPQYVIQYVQKPCGGETLGNHGHFYQTWERLHLASHFHENSFVAANDWQHRTQYKSRFLPHLAGGGLWHKSDGKWFSIHVSHEFVKLLAQQCLAMLKDDMADLQHTNGHRLLLITLKIFQNVLKMYCNFTFKGDRKLFHMDPNKDFVYKVLSHTSNSTGAF